MKPLKHKTAAASLLALTLAAGGVISFGMEYRSGNGFQPFESDRELQNRQVLFSDGGVGSSLGDGTSDTDSFWERDENETENTQSGSGNGYLLNSDDRLILDQAGKTIAQNVDDGTAGENENIRGEVYEFVDRNSGTGSDLILAGGTTGGASSSGGMEQTGGIGETAGDGTDHTGNGSGNSGNYNGGQTETGGDQSGTGGDSGTGNQDQTPSGGEDNEKPGPGSNLTKDPIPGNAKDSKDEVSKDPVLPSTGEDGDSQDFSQVKLDQLKSHRHAVVFGQPEEIHTSGAEGLYKGQKDVDELTLFQSMEAYVWDYDEECAYYWTNKDLDTGVSDGKTKYVRINGVSFDWNWDDEPIREFPVDIPEDAEEITIYLSYRLSPDDPWTDYTSTKIFWGEESPVPGVSYDTFASRILVLNQIVENRGDLIRKENILNTDRQYIDADHAEDGLNLLKYQGALLDADNTGKMSGLFPGWKEDGVFVPFSYDTDITGRHVLEPAALVPYDTDRYQVNLRAHNMKKNYEVVSGGDTSDSTYISLQALTYYVGEDKRTNDEQGMGYDWVETIEVPQYVQSVEFDYGVGICTESLNLPSSVLYVNTNGIPTYLDDWLMYDRGLAVKERYTVSEDNPRYTAEDGVLYNKEETEILGVPVCRSELTVESGISKVVLPYQNQLEYLKLEITDVKHLPEINYERLDKTNCRIVVPDELLSAYVTAEASMLQRTGLSVVGESDLDTVYTLKDGFLLADGSRVHEIRRSKTSLLFLPEAVRSVEAGALQKFVKSNNYTKPLAVIVLPENGEAVRFEDGCFDGYKKMSIACYSDAQVEAVKELESRYPDCDFMIRRITEREDGYSYVETEDGILLCSVPYWIETFDGTIPGENGGEPIRISAIGEQVFESSYYLEWVILPENTVKEIGYGAFQYCWNLEGVFIGETEEFLLNENVFEGCSNLRFIASNAKKMYLYDQNLELTEEESGASFLFCPEDTYNWRWTHAAGVDHYTLEDCGGTRVLYGADQNGTPVLALRSGKFDEGAVTLPGSTKEIGTSAFAGLRSLDGNPISVNWEELNALRTIGAYSFSGSYIGAAVVLPENQELRDGAFKGCAYVTSITAPGTRAADGTGGVALGHQVFADCENLTQVQLGEIRSGSGISYDLFTGSPIEKLVFLDTQAPELWYDRGQNFWFSREQEAAGALKIQVPSGCENAYLEKWRYEILGYGAEDGLSAEQVMQEAMYRRLYNELGREPSEEEVNRSMANRLLRSENRLRKLFGMELLYSDPSFDPGDEIFAAEESGGESEEARSGDAEQETDCTEKASETGAESADETDGTEQVNETGEGFTGQTDGTGKADESGAESADKTGEPGADDSDKTDNFGRDSIEEASAGNVGETEAEGDKQKKSETETAESGQ